MFGNSRLFCRSNDDVACELYRYDERRADSSADTSIVDVY